MPDAANDVAVAERSGRLLKAKEVAAMLGVSTRAVQQWARDGLIPCIHLPGTKLIRFDADRVRQWYMSGCPRPQASHFGKRRTKGGFSLDSAGR